MTPDAAVGNPAERPSRRRRVRVVTGVAAVGLAVVLVAGAAIASGVLGRGGTNGIVCVDVAAERGLTFLGSYGPTVADDPMGAVMQRNMGEGAAVGDIDADGDLDVYLLAQAGRPNRLFRNDLDSAGGRLGFTDITETAGVGDLGLGRAAQFADFDRDGDLDLILANDRDPAGVLAPSRVWRNDGTGRFEDVSVASGFDPEGYLVGGLALVDYDQDGLLDVYVSMWTLEIKRTPIGLRPVGHWPGTNRMYRNEGDLTFRDVTDEIGLGGVHQDTFTAIFHDWDGDADADLYLTVDHREDRYFRNDEGHFSDASEEVGVGHGGNDMGVATSDVDGDGTLDLFVTNVMDPEENFGTKPPGNTLLLVKRTEDGGIRFEDHAGGTPLKSTGWGWGTAFTDIDLDSDLDLFAVQGFDEFIGRYSASLFQDTSRLLVNDGAGAFAPAVGTGCTVEGDQRALIPFDYDRDGDPDYLITQVGLPAVLLENRSPRRHWLTVELPRGTGRDVGAVVTITAGERTSRQAILGGGSYLAGPPPEAYIGLGDATSADVVVTWDDGTSVSMDDVAADQVVRINAPPLGQ